MKKITGDMKICEILDLGVEIEKVFERNSFRCTSCSGADNETLCEAAEGNNTDLQNLIKELNEAVSK